MLKGVWYADKTDPLILRDKAAEALSLLDKQNRVRIQFAIHHRFSSRFNNSEDQKREQDTQ